jgi:hypothetical protein
MKKVFLIILCLSSLVPTSLAQQSMLSIKEYLMKNDEKDPVVFSYFGNRCAAVSKYISDLSENFSDKTLTTRAYKNFKNFAELNFVHNTNKLKMTKQQAEDNFNNNLKTMLLLYAQDAQMNFSRTGEYTTGYIDNDFRECDNLITKLIK